MTVGLLATFTAYGQCDYTVNLYDSYGDGWNGNTIDVDVAGTVTNHTLSNGSSGSVTVNVTTGDSLKITWQGGGSWASECTFDVVDANGNTIFTSPNGGSMTVGVVQFAGQAFCPALLTPTYNGHYALPTSVTVDLTFRGTATNFEVEVGTQGFAIGTGTVVGSTTSPILVSGLAPGTMHDIYYRSYNSTDSSVWAGPVSFQTPCAAIAAYPFIENFDGSNWAGGGSSWNPTSTIDSCWTTNPVSSAHSWHVGVSSSSTSYGPGSDYSGTGQYMYADNYSSTDPRAYLTMPLLDLTSLTTPELSFAYFMYGAGVNRLIVEASADTGASWVAIDSIVGQQQTSQSDNWQEAAFDLTSVKGAFTMVRFVSIYGGWNGDIAIDEVVVQEQPLCVKPRQIGFDNHRARSLDMYWTSSASSFTVEWGPAGYSQGTGMTTTVTDTVAHITGLVPDTEYDFYVFADCSASGNGITALAGPFSSRTLIAPDHTFTLDSYLPDNRWYEFEGTLTSTGVTVNSTFADWSADGWLNNGFTGAVRYTLSTGTWSIPANEWFVTPRIDLDSSGIYHMTFDAAVTDANTGVGSFAADDSLMVLVSTDAGLTWNRSNVEYVMHSGNYPSNTGSTYSVDLSAYTGVVRVGFYMKKTTVNTATANLFIDNITFEVKPACPDPYAFVADSVSTNSINFSWTGDSSATEFYYEWGTCGFTQGTGPVDTVTTWDGMITGLDAATCYDIYIQTNCGSGVSAWAGPFSFYTNCDTLSVPYTEGFETTTGPDLGYCWSYDFWSPNYTNIITGSTGNPGSNSGFNYFEFVSSYDAEVWAFTPEFFLTAGTSYEFSFYYQSEGGVSVTELTAAVGAGQDPAAMSQIIWTGGNLTNSSYTQAVGTFIAPADGLYNIGLKSRIPGFNAKLDIDDLSLQLDTNACPDPVLLDATALGANEVDMFWTGANTVSSFDVEWGPQGFAVGTGAAYGTATVNGDTLNVDTLTDNTCYEYYVRSNCGAGAVGAWVGPFSFCTPCVASPMPYIEDFNAWPPSCVDPAAAMNGRSWTGSNGWAVAQFYNINDDDVDMSMRNVDITTAARVKFLWSSNYLTFYPFDRLTLLARPVGQANYDTLWHKEGADLFSNDGATNTSPGSGVQEYIILPTSYVGQEVEFYFDGYSDWGPHVFVDNFIVEAVPTCQEPFSIGYVANSATASSGTVEFVPGGASNFNIAYGPAATTTTPSGATIINATNDTVTLTGLTDNTVYNVWVRDSCGAGDVSTWTGPVSFQTLCLPQSIPYMEDFSVWPPNCMSTDKGTGVWTGTNGWAEANLYSNNNADYEMTTPMLILTDSAQLSFKWSHQHQTWYPDDSMQVRVRSASGPWTVIWAKAGAAFNSNDGATTGAPGTGVIEFVDLNYGAGDTIQVGFFAHSDWGPDAFVDDVNVYEKPGCDPPSALGVGTVSETSAELYWTAGSAGSTTWWVEYGPQGFQPGNGTSVQAMNDTLSLTGLSAATEYCFYVTEICPNGLDSSATIGQECFVTDCPAAGYAAPYFTDFEVLSPGVSGGGSIQLDNCWSFNNRTSNPRWETEDSEGINENSSGTGPLVDHTFNGASDGMYVFLETSGGVLGDTSSFLSPWVDATSLNAPALSFWYHMYGVDMGNLYVQVRDNVSMTWSTIDSLVGQQQVAQSDAWLERVVVLPVGVIQVKFVGMRGDDYTSDISLDDISIAENTNCVGPTALTSSNQTCTSIDIAWNSANGTSFVEYGAVGFTPGVGSWVSTSSPYTISGLTPGSGYDIYVADTCGGDTLWTPVLLDSTAVGPLPSLNVSSSQDTATMTYADYTLVSGAVDADSVYWDFGAGMTASGMSTTQTFNVNDTVTVTVTAFNGCGSTTVTYDLYVQDISVVESALDRSFNLFPNPSTGAVTVSFDLDTRSDVTLTVVNGMGQPVVVEALGSLNSYNGQLDLSNLPKGMYIVQISTETHVVNQRVVLQ